MKELIYWTVFVFLMIRAGLGFDPVFGEKHRAKQPEKCRVVIEQQEHQAEAKNSHALKLPADLCTIGLHEVH